jgi:hypothetical protein
MEESVKAMEMILESQSMKLKSEGHPEGIEVAPSRIPYRNW